MSSTAPSPQPAAKVGVVRLASIDAFRGLVAAAASRARPGGVWAGHLAWTV